MDFKVIKSKTNIKIFDDKTRIPVFMDEISFSYTLLSDDIKAGKRENGTSPYESRVGVLNLKDVVKNDNFNVWEMVSIDRKTALTVCEKENVLYFDLQTERQDFSEFGINLPFNFMGKLSGGGYKNQYLFNSPYRSDDNKIKFCYLSNVNGRNLAVVFLSDADGWKMDYSKYLGGHYFYNLKCLANFDRAYKTQSNFKRLKLAIFTATDYLDCLRKVSNLLKLPIAYYDESFSFDGTGEVKVVGDCDKIITLCNNAVAELPVANGKAHFEGAKYKTIFTPYYEGKKGGDCSIYGYNSVKSLWEKANFAVTNYRGEFIPDDNACEGQCFVEALMRYSLRFGNVKEFDERALAHIENVLIEPNPLKAKPRATVLKRAFQDYPAYHIFKSRRIQEQFFAVSILLTAYRLFCKPEYLEYAINSLNTLIDTYQKQDGRLERPNGDILEDYSTVCCLIIPIIDVALFIKDKDSALYEKFILSSQKLAEYIYNRGFSFHTEGGETSLAEEEFEDGSISCSALSLLYYCIKVKREKKYLKRAKEILDLHENWVMQTHDCNVYGSSLRWWETRWEGDGDGPAICAGHGWTIWRAEADYWYYKLTGDTNYLTKSICAFTTNFAKFNENTGEGKSIYHVDYITGGGLFSDKNDIKYRIAPRLPDSIDVRLAYYVFNRADETIFNEKDFCLC